MLRILRNSMKRGRGDSVWRFRQFLEPSGAISSESVRRITWFIIYLGRLSWRPVRVPRKTYMRVPRIRSWREAPASWEWHVFSLATASLYIYLWINLHYNAKFQPNVHHYLASIFLLFPNEGSDCGHQIPVHRYTYMSNHPLKTKVENVYYPIIDNVMFQSDI